MKKFFLAAVTIALFLNGSPAFARKVLDIESVQSPGGIKAWLAENHSVPVISIQFAFRGAGSVNDPADKQGLARMASNTMDEGAGDLDSEHFQKELQDLSIDLHFDASRDDFMGTLKTLTSNEDRAFQLLTLALTKPRFDDEAIARMRAANQSRIRSSLVDPQWIAARILNDVAFAGHPYSKNSGGTLSSLNKITAADLHRFHDEYFAKNNLVISVAGDITKEKLAKLLDQIFGKISSNAILPSAPLGIINIGGAGETTVYKTDIPQTILEFMQPGIARKDPDYQLAQVMNFVLGSSGFGSHLTEEIREKRGLTYGIYSSFMNMRYFSGLGVSTSTENINAREIITRVKDEWKKMRETPITDKELKDAQSYLVGSLPLSLTSTDEISGMMLSLELDDLPIDYLEKRKEMIKKATAAEVQRVAKRILDENKFAVILVGEPQGVKNFKTIEKIPDVE